jgi:hypothetical protein
MKIKLPLNVLYNSTENKEHTFIDLQKDSTTILTGCTGRAATDHEDK